MRACVKYVRPRVADSYDRRDACMLANALRTDLMRELNPLDPKIVQLREWSRMSEELTSQRTRLTHQVRDQFWRYFPQFSPVMMSIWTLIPTSICARQVRRSSVEKVSGNTGSDV